MKIKITLFLFCCFQICFSQNIKGNVRATNLPISNVEVINSSKKEVVSTNSEGVFEIKAATGNWLIFYHKSYEIQKIYIDSLFDFSAFLEIQLVEKSIVIEEVMVNKKELFIKGVKGKMPIFLNSRPSVNFSDGTFATPVDFIAVYGLIKKLFTKKDTISFASKEPIQFMAFTKQSYRPEVLAKSLELKHEEIDSFLNFCSFDANASDAVANSNQLMLLQFLLSKVEEYKKIYKD